VVPNPPAAPGSSAAAPEAGWRWESALGVEIQVPDTWTVNEWGCGTMTPNPTVVRGLGAERACRPAEPLTKEIAFITTADNTGIGTYDVAQPLGPTPSDGTLVERSIGRLNDGRYSGAVRIAARDVAVVVRTRSEDLTTRILDSVREVDTDHLGCAATTSWPAHLPKLVAGKPALPDHPARLAICAYLGQPRLQSSTAVTGDTAAAIAAAVNAAKEGPNADAAASECLAEPAMAPDLVLLADGVKLSVVFGPCIGRGITDGAHWSKLDSDLVAKLMAPTRSGYAMSAPLT
jgi:hypothetical protein